MVTEILILAFLGVLGVIAYREIIALRRWDAHFLRRGLVILRLAIPVAHRPSVLPEPQVPPSLFGWRAQVRRLGPHEVAFTAQTSNSPLMKGLLSFDTERSAVVLTARVFWGVLPLFVLGFGGLVLLFQPSVGIWLFLALGLFVAGDYWSERRRFMKALTSVASEVETGQP